VVGGIGSEGGCSPDKRRNIFLKRLVRTGSSRGTDQKKREWPIGKAAVCDQPGRAGVSGGKSSIGTRQKRGAQGKKDTPDEEKRYPCVVAGRPYPDHSVFEEGVPRQKNHQEDLAGEKNGQEVFGASYTKKIEESPSDRPVPVGSGNGQGKRQKVPTAEKGGGDPRPRSPKT